jgi:hypothetical protein
MRRKGANIIVMEKELENHYIWTYNLDWRKFTMKLFQEEYGPVAIFKFEQKKRLLLKLMTPLRFSFIFYGKIMWFGVLLKL